MVIRKINHSVMVGKKMKKMYLERYPGDMDTANEMYTLGFLHDIGYEVGNTPIAHSKRGGELLKRQGYKYWQEVYFHGDPDSGYSSEALDLLNLADLSVSTTGVDVGYKKRMRGVLDRYGEDSYQYKNAKKILNNLNVDY